MCKFGVRRLVDNNMNMHEHTLGRDLDAIGTVSLMHLLDETEDYPSIVVQHLPSRRQRI